jgi:His-Xaa-Ser system protein HxsD
MAMKLSGMPPEVVGAELDEGTVALTVDAVLYPLEALYGAAYVFIDRCWVMLDKPAEGQFRISLASKKGDATEQTLRDLAGEFANELLSCAWRHQITTANKALIESVTLQAIGGAMGPPSLDDLASFDFTEEPFEDPLGIAMSWEEKYKKEKPAKAAEAAPAAPATEAAPAPEAKAEG